MARKGDCFPFAYRFVREHPGAVLVHAEVFAPGIGWIDHAWAEWDGKLFDDQRPEGIPTLDFRRAVRIRAERRFARNQIAELLLRHNHYGPW